MNESEILQIEADRLSDDAVRLDLKFNEIIKILILPFAAIKKTSSFLFKGKSIR